RFLDEPVLVSRKARAGIHALRLEGHPVWSQIAFLQHMRPHIAKRGSSMGRDVIRPAIAKDQEIGDLVVAHEPVDKYWPLGGAPTEVHGAGRPIVPIPPAQVDSVHGQAVP